MAETAFAAPSSSSSFDAMLQPSQEELDKTIESMREKSDAISERATSVADTIAANRAASDKLEMPELHALPKMPEPEMRDPVEAFGSTASMLGILGSMLTRRPLTNALNAAAGTMNAYRANDIQGAKLQYDTWKANMENAKTLHDWEMDLYKGALDKLSTNSKLAMSELEALAHATKNENLIALLQTRNQGQIYKYFEAWRAQSVKMDGMMPKLNEENERQTQWLEWQKTNPNATIDQKIAQRNAIWHPRASAGAGSSGDNLTSNQDMDNARQYFNMMWPDNGYGSREKTLPDGTTVPAPDPKDWLKNEWPKLREQFVKSRGAAAVSPPGGASPPPASSPRAVAPAATPAGGAAPSDFIPIPKELQGKPDGTRFRDRKGEFGKPDQWWIIRGGKAYPSTAPQSGGQGGPAFNQSSLQIPSDVQRQLEALPNNEARLELLNRLDPRGKFRGFSSAADPTDRTLTSLGDTSYKPGELDAFIAQNKAFQAPNVPVVGATPTGRAEPAVDSAKLLKQQALNAAARGFSPEMLAELDRRFPAKAGDKSFTELARTVNTLNQVNRDQSQQFAQDRGKIEDTHNVTLRNTKLLEAAWSAPPKRRAEILKQLEGNWSEATPSQKIEIVKLYVANLMGIGADTAAETATR